MYSWEIDRVMKENNFVLESKTYLQICNTSSQLSHIKFTSYYNFFEIWTNDNYYWKFSVYYNRNED